MTVRMTITPREGVSLTIEVAKMSQLLKELGTAGLTSALPAQGDSDE